MVNLKIGGVPEHFNYPWYLAFKNKAFEKEGIHLRWKDCYGGTGEMCEYLRSGEIDIAVILTEGIIKDISNGNPAKIIQTYVESPLVWGIHVNNDFEGNDTSNLKHKKIAISRYGSGSQLMAIVNAYHQGWDISKLNYEVVDNLDGGIEAISTKKADYFMWELFTTKPYVDSGILKRIGTCPTPWPCFVIAVRNEVLEKNVEDVKMILKIINSYTRGFKKRSGIAKVLADRYQQKEEDIKSWLKITRWNSKKAISTNLISRIQNKMVRFNVINSKQNSARFIKKL